MGSIFPMKEMDERINEIILHGGEKQSTILTVGPKHLCHWGNLGKLWILSMCLFLIKIKSFEILLLIMHLQFSFISQCTSPVGSLIQER